MTYPKVKAMIHQSIHRDGKFSRWKPVGFTVESDYWGTQVVLLSTVESGSVLELRAVERLEHADRLDAECRARVAAGEE